MSVSDLSRQLRSLLQNPHDTVSTNAFKDKLRDFVLDTSASSSQTKPIVSQLEDDLQRIHKDLLVHGNVKQTEIFLSVLFHIRPLLSPNSVISTWFELVLRPALREPKLPTPAVTHAKELILQALLG